VSYHSLTAERFVSDLLPYVPASSERAAIRSLWFQSYLFPESFEVELDVGRRVTIDRAGQELEPSTRRPYEEKIREDGTAYLYIPSFGEPDMEQQAVEFLLRKASYDQQDFRLTIAVFDRRGELLWKARSMRRARGPRDGGLETLVEFWEPPFWAMERSFLPHSTCCL